jgi:hypothetical protein
MTKYEITIRKVGNELSSGGVYGEEFFKLDDQDIVMNLLEMKRIADNDEFSERDIRVEMPNKEIETEFINTEVQALNN